MSRAFRRSVSGRVLLAGALGLVAALAAAPAGACEFDSDCAPGSRCVKRAGFAYGICLGGDRPGNDEDVNPPTDPLDPGGKVGTRCEFDSQCGPGNVCMKEPGSLYGACVRP